MAARKNLYIKIAYWYYIRGLTQDEIAKRLNFTRQKVNQIINSLSEHGIVNINICGYEQDNVDLENQIEEYYGLKEVLVTSDYGEPETAIYKMANVAAQYLDEQIKNGDIIGVSWGKTLAEVISQMAYKRKSACRVVQMMGVKNLDQTVTKADEVCRSLADRLGCGSFYFYAPVIVEYPETREWLLKEKTVRASYEEMKKCNVALVGIGELNEKCSMCTSGHVTLEDIHVLRKQGFVGDVVMNPVRADGSYDHCPMSNRLLNASIECLKEIDNVIAAVSGVEKVEAVNAVLNSGCINTLIIDETAARMLAEGYIWQGKSAAQENEETA